MGAVIGRPGPSLARHGRRSKPEPPRTLPSLWSSTVRSRSPITLLRQLVLGRPVCCELLLSNYLPRRSSPPLVMALKKFWRPEAFHAPLVHSQIACSKRAACLAQGGVENAFGRVEVRTRRRSSAVTVGCLGSPPVNGHQRVHLEPIDSPHPLPHHTTIEPSVACPFPRSLCRAGCINRQGTNEVREDLSTMGRMAAIPGPERKPHPGGHGQNNPSHQPPQIANLVRIFPLLQSFPYLSKMTWTGKLIMERTARAPFRRRGRGLASLNVPPYPLPAGANCAAPYHTLFTQCPRPVSPPRRRWRAGSKAALRLGADGLPFLLLWSCLGECRSSGPRRVPQIAGSFAPSRPVYNPQTLGSVAQENSIGFKAAPVRHWEPGRCKTPVRMAVRMALWDNPSDQAALLASGRSSVSCFFSPQACFDGEVRYCFGHGNGFWCICYRWHPNQWSN
jgi:hypothetical protein